MRVFIRLILLGLGLLFVWTGVVNYLRYDTRIQVIDQSAAKKHELAERFASESEDPERTRELWRPSEMEERVDDAAKMLLRAEYIAELAVGSFLLLLAILPWPRPRRRDSRRNSAGASERIRRERE
jgi:hypothetical protein